jgi:hypothetical protein
MLEEVDFLFDNQLIAAVESLIRNAKHKLLLISPYIDLDARIIDALNEKRSLHNFELLVLFGKNENNYLKSIKRDSLEYLMGFPNVEIRYNERLHAKFYCNDFEYIMTSLNLYDYSLANNIEVGIRCEYGSKGVVGKALDTSISIIGQGVDKVKQEVLGLDKKVGPIEKFELIFDSSDLKYKTEPRIVDKGGISGFMGGKKLDGYDVVVNNLVSQSLPSRPNNIIAETSVTTEVEVTVNTRVTKTVTVKCLSASQLGKLIGVAGKDITAHMQKCGLINGDKITELGNAKGLTMKNYMGNDYIAYPEDLEELKRLV